MNYRTFLFRFSIVVLLASRLVFAQPSAGTRPLGLIVDATTGEIKGPISAAQFKSANNLATSGGGTWGSITGDPSTQTDLMALLNAKVPTSRTVNGKALSANVTIAKADIADLTNVDNTSDADKPVSTAQQAALDLKANAASTQTALDAKISTSVIDTDGTLAANSDARLASQKAVKTYVDAVALTAGSVSSVNGAAGAVELDTDDIPEAADKKYVTAAQRTILDSTTAAFTAAEKTKLSGVATGATANDSNAQLRDRSSHTGLDPVTSLSGTAADRYTAGFRTTTHGSPDTLEPLGDLGAAATLDFANGNGFTGTLTANVTITIDNLAPTSTQMAGGTVKFKQNGTGGYGVTWPAEVVNGADIEIGTNPDEVTIVTLTDFGDGEIYAFSSKQAGEGGGGGASISDVAVASSWNGNTTDGGSKNALHDYFLLFDADLDGKIDSVESTLTWNGGTTKDFIGTGTPEGVVTAGVGSIFRRTDGSTGTTIYFKETGAGNTGWIPFSAGLGLLSDTAVGSSWNGVTTVAPTKNAVHDYLALLDSDLDGKINSLDSILTWNGTSVKDLIGTGDPEGVVEADPGSIYRRTDGGAGTTLYVKETGSTPTGWVAYNPNGGGGAGGSPGGSDTQVQYNNSGSFGGNAGLTVNKTTGALTQTSTSLGTSPTAGITATNSTAAADGAQQVSPSITWQGNGWKTAATAGSQAVAFRSYILPIQGTTNPGGTLTFGFSTNGGSFSDVFSIGQTGTVTTQSSSGFSAPNGGYSMSGAGSIGWTSRGFISQPTDGVFLIRNSAASLSRIAFGAVSSSAPALVMDVANQKITAGRGDGSVGGIFEASGMLQYSGGHKRASEATAATTTTLGNVTGLSVSVVSGNTYSFRAHLFVDASAAGGGKFAIGGTATASSIIYTVRGTADSNGASIMSDRETALGGSASFEGPTAAVVTIEGTLVASGSGTLTVQFAQMIASGTSSVLTGSTFRVEQL
jgi:hypothetical protein